MINSMATLDTGSTQLLQRGHPAHRGIVETKFLHGFSFLAVLLRNWAHI